MVESKIETRNIRKNRDMNDIIDPKRSADYARSLIEASVDPLVTISAEGKITDVNEASISATGVSREELIGSDFSDYFTEPQKAKEGYERVLKEGKVTDYPLTIKHKDGKLMDVLYNASVYKDKKGKVLGVFAAARDITEQKQASQYARSLIEASLDPLVTISAEGKITDVNEASISATGVSREELIGSDFSDYFTDSVKAKEGYEKAFRLGSVTDYALTIKHKDGKLMDVLYNASVYKDEKGNVLGLFAAARDVTKQKQASQYARSLIEASLDPLVTISADGKVTDVNSATEKVTGSSRKQLIGTDFSNYFTEPDKARSGYEEAFKKGEVRDYLLTIRSTSGKLTNVLYNASVYKDENGKQLGVFAAAREIGQSELKSAKAREFMRSSSEMIYKVVISVKGGQGSININDRDAEKGGYELVDNLIINPTRESISSRKVPVLSFATSRCPKNSVIVNLKDAKILGLEGDDTVFISKSGMEQDSNKVSDQDLYTTDPNEFEVQGLNIDEAKIANKKSKEAKVEDFEEKSEKKNVEDSIEKVDEKIKTSLVKEKPVEKSEMAEKSTEENINTKPTEKSELSKDSTSVKIKKKKPDKKKSKQNDDFEDQINALRNT